MTVTRTIRSYRVHSCGSWWSSPTAATWKIGASHSSTCCLYGMEWSVELILRPGSTVLEQSVWLSNRSDARQRFYWWNNAADKLAGNTGTIIAGTFIATGNILFTLLMSPVFAVLFLYNRAVFTLFLEKLAGRQNIPSLQLILAQTINTYFNFIKGMTLVYLIVGLLNSIGLLALGIPHAVLFGMLTAIMTIIPYAGIFISALLPIAVAWISKDSIWYPLGVIGVFSFVQYLEANIIFPKVVAAQLKVSTWATLVAIIAGGLLWGVSGMILFIPFIGILKIITDNLDGYKALNVLLSR